MTARAICRKNAKSDRSFEERCEKCGVEAEIKKNLGGIGGMVRIPLNEFITLQRGWLPSNKRISEVFPLLLQQGFERYLNEIKVKAPGVVIEEAEVLVVDNILKRFFPNTTLYVKKISKDIIPDLFITY